MWQEHTGGNPYIRGLPRIKLEYVLLQRAVLGCKIDGGQHKIGSYTHEDAEVIAATVAGMLAAI